MAIQILYASEKKALPDVYQYDFLSEKLKNQIYYRWNEFLKQDSISGNESDFISKYIYDSLCEETGLKELTSSLFNSRPENRLEVYFSVTKDVKISLSQVQLMLNAAERLEKYKENNWPSIALKYTSKELIEDVNFRFKQNGIGYQYHNGKIIRLDHEFLHSETTQKVLELLADPLFKNINTDFLDAHEHYMQNRLDDCLNDCLKAFESAMKIICDLKRWPYPVNATSKPLIKILLDKTFIPLYQENQLNAMRLLLETGIPTPRNKTSGHGAGNNPVTIPQSMASYLLQITGATIRFLINSYYDSER